MWNRGNQKTKNFCIVYSIYINVRRIILNSSRCSGIKDLY